MSPNVYCPLCGVILLPDPYSDDPTSSQTRIRPWYAEVRGIYSTKTAVGDITTTGLGIVRYRNNLYAPLDSDLSYIDVGVEALEGWRLCERSESRWCFGLHDSCWRLLLLRLGRGQDDYFQNETAIAESVFYQLYCTPCLDASSFQFGHDYDGAVQTHKSFGRPKAVNQSSHFYADPCAIPFTDDLEAIASDFRKAHDGSLWKGRDGAHPTTATAAGIDHHSEGGTCASGPFEPYGDRHPLPSLDDTREERREKLERPKPHIFDGLSPELKFEIFSYLSFDELLNMRLVCRDLALLATVERLPQSYWRSRFLLGQEVDFLFPSLTDTRDWSRLFFGTRASLRSGLLPLVNRKRIRQLLEPIAALVDLEPVLRNGPYGSAFHPAQGNYLRLIDDESAKKPPRFMEIAGSFSGQLASIGADSPLEEGCRVLYHRTQSFMPPCQQHRQRIGISTVQIGARSFISGVNLFPPGECNVVGRPVGYHNPPSEKWIEVPSTSYVKALCVAFCSEGLMGIKFIFTNSDSSGWVGSSNGPGIAHGTLSIPERLNRYYLLAGLDRFKIVSLGLGELTSHRGASLKLPSQGAMDSPRVQSHLWTPHPPRHEGVRISSLLPSQPSRAFEPLTNIDFGGPRGLLLGSLTRLALHMASDPHPLIGIEISYSDGRSVLFGSNRGCGISFFVDGSKGERINRIGILEDNRRYHPIIGLGGLQVLSTYSPSIRVRC